MSYGCKCKCENFREHALGVSFSGKAMPTRSMIKQDLATEKQWQQDGDAYHRLAKEGYILPNLDGAADIEKKATQKIELEHGRIYGDRAKTMQKVADGETA